jgi:AcrR family transcriptional regulator
VTRASDARVRDVILDVVIDMLDSGGDDAVRLQDVAKRARLSLATIYKLFPSRQELLVSALERWMAANIYTDMAMPGPGESLGETHIRLLHTLFEPWERAPHMLKAYHLAVTGPGGERLDAQGWALVEPIARASFKDADPEQVRDIEMILPPLVYGLIGRFTDGHIAITDILPVIERTVARLTGDNPTGPRPQHPQPADRPPPQADRDGRP